MKILKYILLINILFVSIFASAQGSRQSRNDRKRAIEEQNQNQYDVTSQLPCMRWDEPGVYFAASGWIRVKMGGDGERDYSIEATKLLANLRQQVKQKMGGQIRGVTRSYFTQMDVDEKSSEASHIENAMEQVVESFLNDTEEDCRELGEMDEAGYCNLYMGILVKKEDVVNAIVDGLQESKEIPLNVKDKLRADEEAFRESAFKVFDETAE